MIRLQVNIDHVATVRQARRGREPDPVAAAILATLAGADGITVHLREDRRHIQDRDVFRVREAVATRLNFEMASPMEIVAIARQVRPDEATLVPEKREEVTTEGGLDLVSTEAPTRRALDALKGDGIQVALFIDPTPTQVEHAKLYGADAVEFQTASYSEATTPEAARHELDALRSAFRLAHEVGLAVHAGHGLNYFNVQAVAGLPHLEELNIGHSIVSRAVLVGFERAVREMKALLSAGY